MRLIPSEGSGRYSPGPGMIELLEERSYQEIRPLVAICSQAVPGILAIDSLDRQLCGRPRDLLSRHGRRGHDRDAGHDVQAEVDGQRGQDAAASGPRGDVRLSGLYDRPVLLAADGTVLSRDTPVGERDPAPLSRDQRDDRSPMGLARRAGTDLSPQQETGGVGELLLPGPGEQGVSSRGQAYLPSAPPVVACQAPGSDPGILTLSQRGPARCAGTGPPEGPAAQLPVCEGVSSCPRAGCLNRARPVR